MRTFATAILAGSILASPGQAQISGILGSLKNLRATAEQLTHGPNSKAGNVKPASLGGSTGVDTDTQAGDLVNSTFADTDTLDTQMAAAPAIPNNPVTFSIVGLKLGMSVKEARRVAVQQHFRPAGWMMGQSFETQARFAAAGGMARPLPSTAPVLEQASPKTADGGSLGVQFEATSEGARIKSIFYKGLLKGQSVDQVYASMVSRFGKPTEAIGIGAPFKNVRWGGRLGESPKGASLSVNFDSNNGTFDMTLDSGVDEFWAHRKQIDVRAQEIRSKGAGAVSF